MRRCGGAAVISSRPGDLASSRPGVLASSCYTRQLRNDEILSKGLKYVLPERLAAYLTYFEGLANQPSNRWNSFEQSAPDERLMSLRSQVFFSGCALAALAAHPASDPDEHTRALNGLACLIERMIQRRVWAGWASATERTGRVPEPVAAGNAAYAGGLAMLAGFHTLLSGAPRLNDDPMVLHWSSDFRFCYTYSGLAESLWYQMQDATDGAVSDEPNLARASSMAQLLWSNRLHDLACGGDLAAANALWLKTLSKSMALGGPRLGNRGALAASYNPERRRASFGGDVIEDAWALALTAPLAPELVGTLAERHWPALPRIRTQGPALAAAFSYLLAVELGDRERAALLLADADERLEPKEDECGRRYSGATPEVWISALYAIGEAGGLGQILKLAPKAQQDAETTQVSG